MQKRQVTNVSSVVLVFRQKKPTDMFLEMKDGTHPIHLVRGQFCPIGGNWTKLDDPGPLNTLTREITEELSLNRPMRDAVELVSLGRADPATFQPTYISQPPDPLDVPAVGLLGDRIIANCLPYITCACTTTKEALCAADPTNTRPSFTALVNYYLAPLDELTWSTLLKLQERYRNLSNESITIVTDLDSMVRSKMCFAFGHDLAYRLFYSGLGHEEVYLVPTVEGVTSEFVDTPLPYYSQILLKYDVERLPKT